MSRSHFAKKFALAFGVAFLVATFFVQASEAAWNPPGCDPDVDGPTAAACNISAPLNTSSADQTKEGGLTIQDTVSAYDLSVDGTTPGTGGNVTITTVSGTSLSVTNTATGVDVRVNGADPTGASVPAAYASLGTEAVRGASDSSYGVFGYSEAASSTDVGAGVYGEGEGAYATGVLALSDDYYGLYANSDSASTYYGAQICNQGTNCASFGGPALAGLFEASVEIQDQLTVTSNATGSVPVAYFENDKPAIAPNLGYGIQVRNQLSEFTAKTAPQGTSLDVQTDSGYGVYSYSDASVGIWGEGNLGGIVGITGAAGYNGVYGSNYSGSTGYGGFFETTGTDAGLLVRNTNTGSGYGAYISSAGDASTSVYVENTNTTASSASKGIEVVTNSSGSTGIDISVGDFDTAVEANGGSIATTGEYRGGQFYEYGQPSDTALHNTHPYVAKTISMPVASGYNLFFDGSDLWAGHGRNSVGGQGPTRYNVATNQETISYNAPSFTWAVGALVANHNTLYAFSGGDGNHLEIDLDSDSSSTNTYSTSVLITAGVNTGREIWLAGRNTSSLSYKFISFNGSTMTDEITSGIGTISTMVFANNFVWALDTDNEQVHKVNTASSTIVDSIDVGSGPADLIFDGIYLWVSNEDDDTLTRIHVADSSTETIDVSGGGSEPTALAFDGTRVWILFDTTSSDVLAGYSIAKQDIDITKSLGNQLYGDMAFDGTYLWIVGQTNMLKVAIPSGGQGSNTPPIYGGIYIYGQDSNLYCVYIDGSGVLRRSTTLSNCQ